MFEFDKNRKRGVEMEKLEYPDTFIDYIIDNVVLPYIENNTAGLNREEKEKSDNCNMLQLKS